MTNRDLSQKVFDFLTQSQVETVVVCAGARNAALVMALGQTKFKIIQFFEERSAAFFALGLIKSTGRPVAVLTTSGTAVAELLPAAVEATYQALPLLLVTADRPKNYRGSGAPQSIEHVGIFSSYVEAVYDIDVQTPSFQFYWSLQRPLHLNVCFDEPLLDQASGASPSSSAAAVIDKPAVPSLKRPPAQIENPLVLLSELSPMQTAGVKEFLLRTKALIYAESLSQLAADPDLQSQMIRASDVLIRQAFQEKIFTSIIRVGGVPTLRFWRDLEFDFSSVPVFNFSDRPWTGLARPSSLFGLAQLFQVQIQNTPPARDWIKQHDSDLQKQKQALLEKYPLSEPACVARFSNQVGTQPIYLGNSLPIRHWDTFSLNHSKSLYGNRGANGIDGQISTYLGWSEQHTNSFCFIGDLTAMYDLAALGLTPQLKVNRRQIVVLNNFGGQIFQRVLKNKIFINEHQTQFAHWAAMWGWDYQLVKSVGDFQNIGASDSTNTVIEIQPDAAQTQSFWDEWDQACRKI